MSLTQSQTKSRLIIFNPRRENIRERIIIYGRAGIGKSRLALSLPNTEKWGDILYYAADDNSEFLGSVHPSIHPRIKVVKPEGDPIHCFQQFAMTDWRNVKNEQGEKPYANVRTIVVDTYTMVAYQSIQQSANNQSMDREPHYVIGDPKNGGVVIPNRGDYQGIESLSRNFIDTICDKMRDFNIIFVCHEDWKEVAKGRFVGGPAHPGRKMLEDLPAAFNTVIRVIRETVLPPGASVPQMRTVAVTENDGAFLAKIREGDYEKGSPLARVALDRNPINFWNLFDQQTTPTEG